MNIYPIAKLFNRLDSTEILRIELINGNKIYCLPSDTISLEKTKVEIIKPIEDKTKQIIIIDPSAIVVVCTMSRQTYDLKLQRGELYV